VGITMSDKQYKRQTRREIFEHFIKPRKRGSKILMRITEIITPLEALRGLTVDEGNLLFAAGSAVNEIAAIARMMTISGTQRRKGRLYDQYRNSVFFTLNKLLAGKTYEAWQMLTVRYFRTQLSKNNPDLAQRPIIKDQWDILKKYFGRSNNVIALVRNEAAFHYSDGNITAIAKDMDEISSTWLADTWSNSLFSIGDEAMTIHLMNQIDPDFVKAMAIFTDEVSEIASRIGVVLHDLVFELTALALARSGEPHLVALHKLGRMPKAKNVRTPVVLDPSKYKQRGDHLRAEMIKRGFAKREDPITYAAVTKR
jgi:hypothetical protein